VRDLRILPKLRDSWSHIYVEHAIVDQELKSIAFHDENGKTTIPIATLTLLMLGPGTKVTHSAIKTIAESGCLVVWCGEESVRFYAFGNGESRDASRLLKQAKLVSDPDLRLKTVIKMYQMRFREKISKDKTIQQIRGMEGVRVREAYAKASKESGIEWSGRNYKTTDWNSSDSINRALSCANACLYGLCHSAILSLGYSTGLGFIHTGKQLSFVYDVADFYKTETSIPVSFQEAKDGDENLERRIRIAMRDVFKEEKLLSKIAKDIEEMLSIEDVDYDYNFDEDGSIPGGLWDPQKGTLNGGKNYGEGEK
jgi:CRISP-associated protein Cas1